jgi:putative restriction endonuclease
VRQPADTRAPSLRAAERFEFKVKTCPCCSSAFVRKRDLILLFLAILQGLTPSLPLPALDAAHIKPYAESGLHRVNNGILFRRDLHALFDKGYITISPTMHVEVSSRIKTEFENGKDYYRHHGNLIRLPAKPADRPSPEFLEWHNNNVYRG